MVYSNTKYPDGAQAVPPPPLWATWIDYDLVEKGGGVRHHEDFAKAKQYVIARAFQNDWQWDSATGRASHVKNIVSRHTWRIYEWVDGAWVLRYSGEIGDPRDRSGLLVKAIRKRKPPKPDEVQQAINSILGVQP